MSTPQSPTHNSSSIERMDLAAAAERRVAHEPDQSSHKSKRDRELRIQFWRLINPGILRPNSIETALSSMKVLATLSGNVLKEPDNPKYHHFKPTNNAVKRNLVDVKGALEYAVALGFHQKVVDYQPTYEFNPRHLEELRVGNAVLNEAIEQETVKHKRGKVDLKADKEAKAVAARNALLAFEEDRRDKAERDQRESMIRRTAQTTPSQHVPDSPTEILMPVGDGHVLGQRPGATEGETGIATEGDNTNMS